ncbi:hypothetical protein V8E36_000151 [Tilletia maclaganii]
MNECPDGNNLSSGEWEGPHSARSSSVHRGGGLVSISRTAEVERGELGPRGWTISLWIIVQRSSLAARRDIGATPDDVQQERTDTSGPLQDSGRTLDSPLAYSPEPSACPVLGKRSRKTIHRVGPSDPDSSGSLEGVVRFLSLPCAAQKKAAAWEASGNEYLVLATSVLATRSPDESLSQVRLPRWRMITLDQEAHARGHALGSEVDNGEGGVRGGFAGIP